MAPKVKKLLVLGFDPGFVKSTCMSYDQELLLSNDLYMWRRGRFRKAEDRRYALTMRHV